VLVRIDEEGALAIGQLSHAWVSGQLARAWGNELVVPPDPREEIALGAEQHDIGWARFDLEPPFNPQTGLPLNFLELSVEQHLAIWRGAPERVLSQSMHAALVVSLHGRSLSELRVAVAPEQLPALEGHIAEESERQDRLSALLGVSQAQLERTRRQMWTWDGLSLALCNRWRPFTAKDVPGRDGLLDITLSEAPGDACTLDPWPFASERVEVRCEARRLAARYEDEAAMRRALERWDTLTLTFVLVAPAGSGTPVSASRASS
jgi:hypothetical protein